MRSIQATGLALAVLACSLAPAGAQETCTPTVPSSDALGVSRTVEIDTTQGPRFGVQYKDESFLADGEVVLTFDDGPLRAYTVPVLEALAAHCTKATFFSVGRMAAADPELVREYARRGHTIGTHTWSHSNLRSLSPARARVEIELGISAVQKAAGKPLAPFFRFPYLSDPKGMIDHLKQRQIGIFSIDVDSKDFRTRDPGTVHRRVMAGLAHAKKGIILFHDIQPSTARALPALLADLKAKGYRVVHMVPKAAVATVAEFDSQAEKDLERRRAKVADQPLANRALTWPVASDLPKEPAAVRSFEISRPRGRRAVPRKQTKDWPSNIWLW